MNIFKYTGSFLAVAVACSLWGADPAIQNLMKEGNDALRSGNMDQAKAVAARIQAQESGKVEAAFLYLQIANRSKDVELAQKQILEIRKSDVSVDRKIEALKTYAWLCRDVKKRDECRKAFQDCLDLKKEDIKHVHTMKMFIADTYWNVDKAKHEELLMEIFNDGNFSTDQKIAAVHELCSKIYSPAGSSADIMALLDKAEKLPELTYSQKLNLLGKRADGLLESLELDKARALYQQFEKENPEAGEYPGRLGFLKVKADFFINISDYKAAADIFNEMASHEKGYSTHNIRRMIELYHNENLTEYAMAEAERILKNTVAGKHSLIAGYKEVIAAAINCKQFRAAEQFISEAEKLPDLTQQDKESLQLLSFNAAMAAADLDQASARLALMLKANNRSLGDAALQLSNGYYERRELQKAVDYAKYVPVTLFRSGNWVEMGKIVKMLYAYGMLDQNKALAEKARELAGNPAFNARERARLTLIGVLAENEKAQVKKVLEPFALTDEQCTGVLGDVGKYFVKIGRNHVAEKLYAERQSYFTPEKRNELKIRYVENAPDDVGSWLASPLLNDPANRGNVTREYGAKEAAFLITDVMAAGRNVGDTSVKADKETYFYVCYDEYGIHLFFVGVDSKVKDVMNNRIGGSGYEMYLGLGEGGPAYQWLFDQPKDNFYSPPWNSPHEYYRNLGAYINISSRPIENGIATAMNFSWELAYDRLPENGDLWPFELIRWTRGGGVTWGGKSVWQIGNWGRLKFEGLDEKVMQKIRSVIIYKALSRYNSQKQARSGGLIAIWQDTELGDPEFYKNCLAPEVERLDALSKLVTDNMDQETVEKLWVEAVPYWFDFQYRAAALRRDYLQNNFILDLK